MHMPSIEEILNILVIIGILGGWFHIVALRPLKLSIDSLQHAIEKMDKAIEASVQDRRDLSNELSRVATSVQEAHKRIDRIEGRGRPYE